MPAGCLIITEADKEGGRGKEMISDFLLIQKIRNGDNCAGNEFVKKYSPLIYQYCFLHIHDRDCAEDMTQETFVRFFEAVMNRTDIAKVKSYLYRVAGNTVKNYYRKKKELLLEKLPDTVENNAADIEVRLDIERAVARLPDEIREITILFFFQGLKQKDISDLLGIKLSLVKYRVSKAKELLSEELEVGTQ